MKCASVKKLLDEYLLNELEPDVEMKINEHCALCTSCRNALDEFREVHETLKQVEPAHPSAGLYDRLIERMGRERSRHRFLWIFPRTFVYSAIAFFFGIVVMYSIENITLKRGLSESMDKQYEPTHHEIGSDTIAFYSVPAEHLVRRQ
jgi:predicted anti-sigma-YlaC factor YlaD